MDVELVRSGGDRLSRWRIITFKADEDLVYLLDEYASRMGVSRSEVIREAIREYLERRGVKVVLRPKLKPNLPITEVEV